MDNFNLKKYLAEGKLLNEELTYTFSEYDYDINDDAYQAEVEAGIKAKHPEISDKDLKDNITPIENPIDKIKEIGGYEFDWNNKSSYEGHDVGVIAQEIEKVLPEVVTTRDNGYKAVKYEKIVALLIEGIKEQQLQIDDLKKQLNEKN